MNDIHKAIKLATLELVREAVGMVEEAREKGVKPPIKMDIPTTFDISGFPIKDLQREIYSTLIRTLEQKYKYIVRIKIDGVKVGSQTAFILINWISEIDQRTRDNQDEYIRAHMIN